MNIKSILKIGLKVLIAGVTGFAMYIGLNGRSAKNQNSQQQNPEFDPRSINQTQVIRQQEENCEFVDKLKNVQEVGGKLLTFIQSLTMTADSFFKVFTGNNTNNPYQAGQQSYFNNSWGNYYRQPVNFGNGVMGARISPFVMEIY